MSHKHFIRSLPCVCCGARPTDPAHIRKGTNGGMGLKPTDHWIVPLCRNCHNLQHNKGEASFWGKNLEDAKALANALWVRTGDKEMALKQIVRFRNALHN